MHLGITKLVPVFREWVDGWKLVNYIIRPLLDGVITLIWSLRSFNWPTFQQYFQRQLLLFRLTSSRNNNPRMLNLASINPPIRFLGICRFTSSSTKSQVWQIRANNEGRAGRVIQLREYPLENMLFAKSSSEWASKLLVQVHTHRQSVATQKMQLKTSSPPGKSLDRTTLYQIESVNAILQAWKSLYLFGKLVLCMRILIYESLVSSHPTCTSHTIVLLLLRVIIKSASGMCGAMAMRNVM